MPGWLKFLFGRNARTFSKPDMPDEEATQWEEQRWNRERLERLNSTDDEAHAEPTEPDCPEAPDEIDTPH